MYGMVHEAVLRRIQILSKFLFSVISQWGKKHWVLTYLVHMDVIKVVFVIDGFEETFQLSDCSSMNHQHENHPDWVLHLGEVSVSEICMLDRTGDH